MKESSGSQFFRTTTGIQSEPDAFDKSRFIMIFLTILWVKEILCSFILVLKRKTGKEISESSRLAFLEELSANDFALSSAEDNTSRPLNTGGIVDLPLLRTLLAIYQKFRVLTFWKVMDSCFINPFGINEKNDLYELWQQRKQLKTMEMSETWPNTFYEGYIHQFQPEPTQIIQCKQQKHCV